MRNFSLSILFILFLSLFGCQGDDGPVGPQGVCVIAEETFVIDFRQAPETIRADGISSKEISAHITIANGNSVVGQLVTFHLVSGDGSIDPIEAETDLTGKATSLYTSGLEGGTAVVGATVTRNGLTTSSSGDLYTDPLAFSAPLLSLNSSLSMQSQWSPDGTTIYYTIYNDGMYKVNADGGEPQRIGDYSGGVWNPDGSNRMVVFNSANEIFILDDSEQIITGPILPSGFMGSITAIEWASDGTNLVICSNTNRYVYWLDLTGTVLATFSTPVTGRYLSSVPGTDQVVIMGTENYSGYSIYLVDLSTQIQTPILQSNVVNMYGVSVSSDGLSVLYSGSGNIGYSTEIYEIPLTGGVSQVKVSSPLPELLPQWSPDGERILFCSMRSGIGYNLFIYDIGVSLSD